MKEFIIKSNEWYNNVPEPYRFLLMIMLVGLPLLIVQISNFIWGYTIWGVLMCILVGWRMAYTIIKIK